MRQRVNRQDDATQIGFNATPMVDVIFMLTVFFMLVSSFSAVEHEPLELPRPTHSQAVTTRIPDRVVINGRPANPLDPSGGGVLYSIGPNRPVSLAVLKEQLAVRKRAVPDLKVILRADRRLPYAAVRAVMQVVARNEIELLNVAAAVGDVPVTP
ncbi:MAG: ExbD/TolR family protein [Phycisphaerae bacterium]